MASDAVDSISTILRFPAKFKTETYRKLLHITKIWLAARCRLDRLNGSDPCLRCGSRR